MLLFISIQTQAAFLLITNPMLPSTYPMLYALVDSLPVLFNLTFWRSLLLNSLLHMIDKLPCFHWHLIYFGYYNQKQDCDYPILLSIHQYNIAAPRINRMSILPFLILLLLGFSFYSSFVRRF